MRRPSRDSSIPSRGGGRRRQTGMRGRAEEAYRDARDSRGRRQRLRALAHPCLPPPPACAFQSAYARASMYASAARPRNSLVIFSAIIDHFPAGGAGIHDREQFWRKSIMSLLRLKIDFLLHWKRLNQGLRISIVVIVVIVHLL